MAVSVVFPVHADKVKSLPWVRWLCLEMKIHILSKISVQLEFFFLFKIYLLYTMQDLHETQLKFCMVYMQSNIRSLEILSEILLRLYICCHNIFTCMQDSCQIQFVYLKHFCLIPDCRLSQKWQLEQERDNHNTNLSPNQNKRYL